jgi:hypothetical protein
VTIRINLSAGFGRTQNAGGGWLQLARDCETIGYDHLKGTFATPRRRAFCVIVSRFPCQP